MLVFSQSIKGKPVVHTAQINAPNRAFIFRWVVHDLLNLSEKNGLRRCQGEVVLVNLDIQIVDQDSRIAIDMFNDL